MGLRTFRFDLASVLCSYALCSGSMAVVIQVSPDSVLPIAGFHSVSGRLLGARLQDLQVQRTCTQTKYDGCLCPAMHISC